MSQKYARNFLSCAVHKQTYKQTAMTTAPRHNQSHVHHTITALAREKTRKGKENANHSIQLVLKSDTLFE